ncbi:MAG: SpoIID/LytB domain-containing protein [Ignavibacteriaceae bacterium]|jgi:SpoIID/LytB domain protein|nr:SpoIID/LytB domain-containing protein [Ignavibacteriaceae bacterium]MCU0364171.1 SpoIID/LytB domain-containing protein [Ignavibacteriaceae bacterium]MCU0412813.1 SpoIID/LytB domain-containing protein [Ignavibacteriaceae bacterium]
MLYGEEPYISVGILIDKKIKFELYGDFSVAGSREIFSGIYSAEIKNDRIVCKSSKHEIEGYNQIEFIPSDPISESFLLRDVIIGSKFHWERKEKQRFIYSLLLLKASDKIIAINYIPLERYLTSVISSEMSAKSSIELLKAQAVIARSWVLAQIARSEKLKDDKEIHETSLELKDELIRWYDREDHNLFDVCADDHCQRFQGVTKIISDASFKAIEQTKGIILLSGGDVCDARYSKCCGGITESFENVWEPVKHLYLTSVVDYKFEPENFKLDFSDETNSEKWIMNNPAAYCNTSDRKILSHILVDYDRETKDFFRWKVEYTQDELSSLIKEKSGIDFGNIIDLVPVERGESARLVKLKIVGTSKTLTVGKELEIRRLLSKTHLYSSAFIVEKIGKNIPEKIILYGAGWGHGVGLCQIGAAVMAEMGYNFDEILLHYFKNSELKKIY